MSSLSFFRQNQFSVLTGSSLTCQRKTQTPPCRYQWNHHMTIRYRSSRKWYFIMYTVICLPVFVHLSLSRQRSQVLRKNAPSIAVQNSFQNMNNRNVCSLIPFADRIASSWNDVSTNDPNDHWRPSRSVQPPNARNGLCSQIPPYWTTWGTITPL